MRLAAAALVLAALVVPGIAQSREVAGWTVLDLDDSCVMAMEFEGKGETELSFFYAADGGYLLTIANAGWTPIRGNIYQVTIDVDGTRWGPGPAAALKEVSKPTLALGLSEASDFEQAFRGGRSLRVYLGDELIDQLSLSGTDAAGRAARQCSARVALQLAADAREKARFEHLPDDPFSGDGPVTSINPDNLPDQPARLKSANISNSDYPSVSLRNGESGKVTVRVTVGTAGRATACSVSSSSGSSTLDATTCRLVQSRSRFASATDAGGNPIETTLFLPITWSLPTMAAPPTAEDID